MKIDLGTAASLDRQTVIDATARLMNVAAHDNSTVLREILGHLDSAGQLDAWKKAMAAYPNVF